MASASARTRLVWMSWTRTSWAASARARSSAPAAERNACPAPRPKPSVTTTAEHRDHRASGRACRPGPRRAAARQRRRGGRARRPRVRSRRRGGRRLRRQGAGRHGAAGAARHARCPGSRCVPPDAVAAAVRRRDAASSAVRRPGPRRSSWRSWSVVGAVDVAQPPGVAADRGLEDVAGEPAVAERRSRAGCRQQLAEPRPAPPAPARSRRPSARLDEDLRRARRRCSPRTRSWSGTGWPGRGWRR